MRVIIVAGLIVCAAAEFALAVATTLLLTVVGSLSGVALAAAVVLVLVQLGAGCLFVVAAADPTLPRRLTRRVRTEGLRWRQRGPSAM